MSSFTQFTGSNVPFGQKIVLIDSRSNPTVSGIEYLKYGVLKSSANYASLIVDWPQLGINTNSGITYAQGSGASYTLMLTDGTRYYTFEEGTSGGAPKYGTNLTSAWTTFITSAPAVRTNDAFRFGDAGTILINVGSTAAGCSYISGTTATAFSLLQISQAGAANSAGTLGVIAYSGVAAGGNIYTSTNGTTWTNRTPSGGGLGIIYYAAWSPVGNRFIYVDASGNIATTTDGFTLTSRGATGVTSLGQPSTYGFCPSAGIASSAASTLMMVYSLTGNSHIVRTVDGISFTATSTLNLLGESIFISSLKYFNGAYYITTPGFGLYKSTDEGLTWLRLPDIISTPYVANQILFAVTSLNGNIIGGFVYTGSANAVYGVLSNIDTATYVGALPVSNAPTNNNYVRIK